MQNVSRDTKAWSDEDTSPETIRDIGEMPTLRWMRAAAKADEPTPATLRWGSELER